MNYEAGRVKRGFPFAAMAGIIALVFVFGFCKREEAPSEEADGMIGINIFTEIWQFPDRGAYTREGGTLNPGSNEPMRFAERYMRIYEERVKKMGGKIPLEGSERVKFEKEMMLIQSGVLFDMRLGADHPAKKKFLDIAAWTFDQRQPIIEKRRPYVMAEEEVFKKAEERDFRLHDRLLADVKKKLKEIFTDREYGAMIGID